MALYIIGRNVSDFAESKLSLNRKCQRKIEYDGKSIYFGTAFTVRCIGYPVWRSTCQWEHVA